MSQLHIVNHPMVQHKLTIMRDKNTGTKQFRELLQEISMLMGYELTSDFPLSPVEIDTPICKMTACEISGKKLAIVPILRAGLGMADGILKLLVRVGVGVFAELFRKIAHVHDRHIHFQELVEDRADICVGNNGKQIHQ